MLGDAELGHYALGEMERVKVISLRPNWLYRRRLEELLLEQKLLDEELAILLAMDMFYEY